MLAPQDAATLLEARKLVSFDKDGTALVMIDGEARPLDAKSVSKVVGPHLMRSHGVPGSGGPRSVAVVSSETKSLDLERAKTAHDYFVRNRTAIMAELRRRQGREEW
ncbi:MAG: hypothetical protein ACRD3M_06260 [Thermoanaerobaculia bacterium]